MRALPNQRKSREWFRFFLLKGTGDKSLEKSYLCKFWMFPWNSEMREMGDGWWLRRTVGSARCWESVSVGEAARSVPRAKWAQPQQLRCAGAQGRQTLLISRAARSGCGSDGVLVSCCQTHWPPFPEAGLTSSGTIVCSVPLATVPVSRLQQGCF